MPGMAVQAALAVVLLLFTNTVESQSGDVSFWRLDVTMRCPGQGKWFEKDQKTPLETDDGASEGSLDHTFAYNGKARYRCEYTPRNSDAKKYYFYVEGKVCKDCFELDARLLILVIVLDVVGTALLMMIICMFTKTKSPAGPAAASSKAPARSGGRPTPASGSEYEQLNRQTVSAGTYSVVNRTG